MAVLTKCNRWIDAYEILGNRDRKKIGHNTYLQRIPSGDPNVLDAVQVVYHKTAIVTYFSDCTMVLNVDTFFTMTTKERLNQLTPLRISQKNNIWYLGNGTKFFNGLICDEDGNVLNPQSEEHQDEVDRYNRDIKKKIKKFLDGYLNELVLNGLPMPSNGDCWYCLGMLDGTDHHLLDHIEESYFVPSLAVAALRERGYQDAGIYMFLDMQPDENKMGGRSTEYGTRVSVQTVRAAMRKYLQKRLIRHY